MTLIVHQDKWLTLVPKHAFLSSSEHKWSTKENQ